MNSNDAMSATFIELDAEGPLSQLNTLKFKFRGVRGGVEQVPAGAERNAYRANLVADALLTYGERVYSKDGVRAEPLEQTIRDFLSDLEHLCNLLEQTRPDEGFDLPTLFERARAMVADEVTGDF